MLRRAAVVIALVTPQAAFAADELCRVVASAVDRSLHAYAPRMEPLHPADRISIGNAVMKHPAQQLGLFETLAPQTPPEAVVAAIYRTASGVGGDYAHSISVCADPHGRAHYLSERLQRELKDMESRTPAGDVRDLDFDPITAGQDPDVRGLRIATLDKGAKTATVLVECHRGGAKGERNALRYSLARENSGWRVDDIAEQRQGGWRLSAILKRP